MLVQDAVRQLQEQHGRSIRYSPFKWTRQEFPKETWKWKMMENDPPWKLTARSAKMVGFLQCRNLRLSRGVYILGALAVSFREGVDSRI